MNFKTYRAALKTFNLGAMTRLSGMWRTLIRHQFLYAAITSGLLDHLRTPRTRREIAEGLGITNGELLDALLEVGVTIGELGRAGDRYRVRGGWSKALLRDTGDPFRAFIEMEATYYSSVYRNAPARLKGAPKGNYLEWIGPIVARVAMLLDPFVHGYVEKLFRGSGPGRVLDIGCGAGMHLKIAAAANPALTGLGIDMDPAVVTDTRANLAAWGIHTRFNAEVADIRDAADRYTGYDAVMLFNMLYYFPVGDRTALLAAVGKMLAPGGRLIIGNSMLTKGNSYATANLDMALRSIDGCYPLPDLEELQEQLAAAGFEVREVTRLIPGDAFFGITCMKRG